MLSSELTKMKNTFALPSRTVQSKAIMKHIDNFEKGKEMTLYKLRAVALSPVH